jgi:hypothetical protein
MTEMVERVARALYDANKFKRGWDHPKINKNWHRIYRAQAKNAISEMRHALPSMIELGKSATGDGEIFLTDEQIRDCWYAMICAALKETEHA